jgi:hypothetical protein
MKRAVWLILFSIMLVGCGESYEVPENALDSGRQFIESIFKGNFKRARQLMLPDDANQKLLDERLANDFRTREPLERDRLRNASIVINEIENVSDSVTIINFKNSYDDRPAVLKVVKYNGQWLSDLKYTFSGNF